MCHSYASFRHTFSQLDVATALCTYVAEPLARLALQVYKHRILATVRGGSPTRIGGGGVTSAALAAIGGSGGGVPGMLVLGVFEEMTKDHFVSLCSETQV